MHRIARELGGFTVDQLEDVLSYEEFCEHRAIFRKEDKEVADQRADIEQKKRELEAKGAKGRGGGGATSGTHQPRRLPSPKAGRQAEGLSEPMPRFRPPGRSR